MRRALVGRNPPSQGLRRARVPSLINTIELGRAVGLAKAGFALPLPRVFPFALSALKFYARKQIATQHQQSGRQPNQRDKISAQAKMRDAGQCITQSVHSE